MEYAISLVLIALSALFSGLTLGYFTLDVHNLKRQVKLGNPQAQKIAPVRERGNHLLTTLLFGNVAVNSILSVYLSSLASGIVAAMSATALIFLFGEIIPQAVISRHAMRFGALFAPLVRLLMIITSPVTYPIAFMLDKLLGNEMPTMFTKHELMEIISEHEDSEHSSIDADEERIIHGALRFSHMVVQDAMTPIQNVIMFDEHEKLNDDLFEAINHHGFSRYPIYSGNRSHIVGLLFAKDLIVEDEDISIRDATDAFESSYLKARSDELLDAVLTRMLKQRRHIAIVFDKQNTFVGVITLEDIIEEIIQYEIEDEDDAEISLTSSAASERPAGNPS